MPLGNIPITRPPHVMPIVYAGMYVTCKVIIFTHLGNAGGLVYAFFFLELKSCKEKSESHERRHERIHACAECHGARVLKQPHARDAGFAILRMNTH